MYCSKCGKQISDMSRFCPHCGNQTQISNFENRANSSNGPVNVPSQGIINQLKDKLTKSKWIVLLLSSISFIFLFIIPYVTIYKKSSSYPIWLIGGNDYPSSIEGDYDAGFSAIMLFLIACIITIIVSLIMEKHTLCLIASCANVFISFMGFSIVMSMVQSANSQSTSCMPIGSLLNLGLGIAVLVLIIKEKKKAKNQTTAFIYR